MTTQTKTTTAGETAKGIERRFVNSLKSGSKSLAEVKEAIEHVKAHGDTNVIVNMMKQAKVFEPSMVSLVRKVFLSVYPGATITAKSIKIAGIAPRNSSIVNLSDLVAAKKSIRSKDVREQLFTANETKAKSVNDQAKTKAENIAKFLLENGMTASVFAKTLEVAVKEAKAATLTK